MTPPHIWESIIVHSAILVTPTGDKSALHGRTRQTERDVVRLVSEGLGNNDIAVGFSSHRAPFKPTSPTSTPNSGSAPAYSSPKKLPATREHRHGPGCRVVDRLVRLDVARDHDHGGAGLGLPTARALARAHHGDLAWPAQPPRV
jgi:hypothetical protein